MRKRSQGMDMADMAHFIPVNSCPYDAHLAGALSARAKIRVFTSFAADAYIHIERENIPDPSGLAAR